MSRSHAFVPPAIADSDIAWVCGLLGLPRKAFEGEEGTDPRQDVLKSMESMDIAACPGSGKTTLLVAKLAVLAQRWHERTRGMCVVSHTNAARTVIQTELSNTSTGRRLLSYPHFIGTIHGFVNEFLALPWLRSNGYPVKLIDTHICEKRRWAELPQGTKRYLQNERIEASSICIVDRDFNVALTKRDLPFSRTTRTYQLLKDACARAAKDGYHCHDDMFIWARSLILDTPAILNRIRDRFPLIFIDEAQDNSELQSAIISSIFPPRSEGVIRQRFGDANQAIFNSTETPDAATDRFPDPLLKRNLENSHRFGQAIADLARPLGLEPHRLKGNGPKEHLVSGSHEPQHTIFAFNAGTANNVLEAYGKLLIATFSDSALQKGSFWAVGQVHRDKGDNNHPRHIGHYWPEYDPQLSTPDPKPDTLMQYLLVGIEQSRIRGETHPVIEKTAEGLFRLAGSVRGTTSPHARRASHRALLAVLADSPILKAQYQTLISEIVVQLQAPERTFWNTTWRKTALAIAEKLAGQPPMNTGNFLQWKVGLNSTPTNTQLKQRSNIYRCGSGNKRVEIRLGSIHSIKGQTHTATLVLETFWNRHNVMSIIPWLSGKASGCLDEGIQQRTRLKIHYTAMTRPTHLLCLAMRRCDFEEHAAQIREVGWHIEFV